MGHERIMTAFGFEATTILRALRGGGRRARRLRLIRP
jgi:hypothetical protein